MPSSYIQLYEESSSEEEQEEEEQAGAGSEGEGEDRVGGGSRHERARRWRRRSPSKMWQDKRQKRADDGRPRPAALACSLARCVVLLCLKHSQEALEDMLKRLQVKDRSALEEKCVEATKSLREARQQACEKMGVKLEKLYDEPLNSDYTSTFWNTPLGGLPFEWGMRQRPWAVRVKPGVYRGGEALCAAITEALATVSGLPRGWRLVAKFQGCKGRSPQVRAKRGGGGGGGEREGEGRAKREGGGGESWPGLPSLLGPGAIPTAETARGSRSRGTRQGGAPGGGRLGSLIWEPPPCPVPIAKPKLGPVVFA